MSEKRFTEIDKLHYEIENKLLRLVRSLEKKKIDRSWNDEIREEGKDYNQSSKGNK
jgi:hypothetical protein